MEETIQEYRARALSGWLILPILLIFLGAVAWKFFLAFVGSGSLSVLTIFAIPVIFFLFKGFMVLEPNQAGVMVFFGNYAGSIATDGLFWVNPFYQKEKISLRAHNLNTPVLKVNDRSGSPIDVAAVIVWRVRDTARATFDVEDYMEYVVMQSESAVRQVISVRWYDGDQQGNDSLRSDLDTVALLLKKSIQTHCAMAGLEIIEARISHLAYSAEIASAMLRRQQAVAVVAARREIVTGATSIVKLAIDRLEHEGVLTLDAAGRSKLVTNLMTVLVADSDTQPVVSVDGE